MERLGAFNISTREVKELLLFLRIDRDYLEVASAMGPYTWLAVPSLTPVLHIPRLPSSGRTW